MVTASEKVSRKLRIIEIVDDINRRQGISEKQPWAREAEKYISRLPPKPWAEWLDPLRAQVSQWDKFQNKIRKSFEGSWSDGFPWVWEMEKSVPDRCVVAEHTFDSIEGFMDCLQTRVTLSPY